MDDLVLTNLVNGVLNTLFSVAAGRNITLVNQLGNDLPARSGQPGWFYARAIMGLLSYVLQHLVTGQIIIEATIEQGVNALVTAVGKFQVR